MVAGDRAVSWPWPYHNRANRAETMSSVEALQKCLRDKLETMSGFGDEKKQIAILKKFFAEFDTDGSGNVARKK